MPLPLATGASTLLIQKTAFERAGLTRAQIDRALTLTDQEFRVEGDVIAIGPVYDDSGLTALIEAFEQAGLAYFDDFFEMSGNWPEWLAIVVLGKRG
jgi:hypothetical protein